MVAGEGHEAKHSCEPAAWRAMLMRMTESPSRLGVRFCTKAVCAALRSLGAAVAVMAGCAAPGADGGSAGQLDRLVKNYPELQAGRFRVIADFEDPRHLSLFRLGAGLPGSGVEVDPRGGRRETGRSALAFTSAGGDEALVVSNDAAQDWFLPRDWRPFDLLLIGLRSDDAGARAVLTVVGGAERRRISTQVPLNAGWNLLRFDVGELAEQASLDDVREVRVAVASARTPCRVWVDDIILTEARQDVFGDSSNTAGDLYVRRVGRRWLAGAGGRFELVFSNGQITGWYDLSQDPNRLQNLVAGGSLAPAPVLLRPGSDASSPPAAEPFATHVNARQELLEANEVRCVVRCLWHAPEASADAPAIAETTYAIYASGQVYAEVQLRPATPEPAALQTGLAVAPGKSWQVRAVHPAAGADGDTANGLCYAVLNQGTGAGPMLLYAVRSADGSCSMTASDAGDTGAMVVASAAGGMSQQSHWPVHLCLLGAEASLDEARARAAAFGSPPPPTLELGTAALQADGRRPDDAFDRRWGCYRLEPDRGTLRVQLQGLGTTVFTPCFQVDGTASDDAWVYVNHLIHTRVARLEDGSILFQLRPDTPSSTRIEVLTAPTGGTSATP